MKFPLNKKVLTNSSATEFLPDYSEYTEIPLGMHPGAFSTARKNHRHEGVDLYCCPGDEVYAIESGIVVMCAQFTGEAVGSGWWADTYCVMIEGQRVFNYGEITPIVSYGQKVSEGQVIGVVKTVLLKDKGRPMTMLHLEEYRPGTLEPTAIWPLQDRQPHNLLDPTQTLLSITKRIKYGNV